MKKYLLIVCLILGAWAPALAGDPIGPVFTDGTNFYYGAETNNVFERSATPVGINTSTGAWFPSSVFVTNPPTDNYVLKWDAGAGKWGPEAAAGGTTVSNFMFRVRKTSNQSVNNTTFTEVAWEAADFNIGNGFNLSSNRFYPPANGYYVFNADTGFQNVIDDGEIVITALYVNGSAYQYERLFVSSASANQNCDPSVCVGPISLTTNDYVSVYTYHNEGAAQNISTNTAFTAFSGWRLLNGTSTP